MLRATAYVLRFINNLKGRSKKSNTNLQTVITKHERDLAEPLWFIYVQKDVFTDKQFEQLKHSSLSFNTKHAIFLPKYYFIKIVTLYYHQKVLHNGVKQILNEIRTRF